MEQTLDKIIDLNLRSSELFESSKSASIRDNETKEANRKLADEIGTTLKTANTVVNGTAQELGVIRRVKVRLNSALRLVDKFLDVYAESNKVNAEKERRQKEAKESRIKLLQERVASQKNDKAERELKRLQGDVPALEERKKELEVKIEETNQELKKRGRPRKGV